MASDSASASARSDAETPDQQAQQAPPTSLDMPCITPWEANTGTSDATHTFNYDHIIAQFGCQRFTPTLVERVAQLTGAKPHRFFCRGLVFAHRDMDVILDAVSRGEPLYIYTGRGPSSSSLHIGHALPLIITQYLQQAFRAPVVVQMTDDEKMLCRGLSFSEVSAYCLENIKDVIAFGFDPALTYIFTNIESAHLFAPTTLRAARAISLNEAMKVFGFDINTPIGMVEFPAKQIAAGFASSFPFVPQNARCLIPCSVDQDPYFRLARDKAHAIGGHKPATLYVQMLPSLLGTNCKMSASDMNGAIYMSDTPAAIQKKIAAAFSGGQESKELHRQRGGNPDVDIAFQYLRFFLEDDEKLHALEEGYRTGCVLSSAMKKHCVDVIQAFVADYQAVRSRITAQDVQVFKSYGDKL